MGLPARASDSALTEADQWESDALAAILDAETPEQAELVLAKVKAIATAALAIDRAREREQRWARIRLMAERRYGELLGPPMTRQESGGVSGTNTSPAERVAQHEARRVAAVPEPDFRAYVERTPQPTRSGLLREATERDEPVIVDAPIFMFATEIRIQHEATDQPAADAWRERLIKRITDGGGTCVHRHTRVI